MGKEAAVAAYHNSLVNAADYEAEYRANSRSIPLVGGFTAGLKLFGNALVRPFKVGGALMFGSDAELKPIASEPPAFPEEFKGTTLGEDFQKAWELNKEAITARTSGFGKLINLDVSGWWKDASIAAHSEMKEAYTVFPEEAQARALSGDTFSIRLANSRGEGGGYER